MYAETKAIMTNPYESIRTEFNRFRLDPKKKEPGTAAAMFFFGPKSDSKIMVPDINKARTPARKATLASPFNKQNKEKSS
jgi:hypothetical protein